MTITKNLRPGLTAWAPSTAYNTVDMRRSNGGNAYHIVTPGTSASSGGPTGTGSSITDGSCVWKWTSTFDASDIYAFIPLIIGPVTDRYDMVIWNDNEILCFWSNPGVVSCTGHNTTSAFSINFRCAPGESFADSPSHLSNPLYPDPAYGVCMTRGPNHDYFMLFQENFGTFDGIQMRRRSDTASLNSALALGGQIAVTRTIIRSYNNQQPGNGITGSGVADPCSYTNCTLIDYQPSGNNSPIWNGQNNSPTFTNCNMITLNAQTGDAIHRNYSGVTTVTNCNIFGWAGIGNTNMTSGVARNNVVDFASYPSGWTDTGTLFGKTAANQFVRVDNNFRLRGGADAINAGYADITHLPTAVDTYGTSRPQGSAWDVGPHEWTQAPILASIGSAGAAAGRNYSTITSWIAALPMNLVTDGNSYVGQCYNDSVFNNPADNGMTFSGFTTDATHTITLTAAAGQSFIDNPNRLTNALRFNSANGVSIVQPGDHVFVIQAGSPYITISRIQAKGTGGGIPRFFFFLTSNCTVDNCIVESTTKNNNTGILYFDSAGTIRNTLIVSTGTNQIGLEVYNGTKVINCTLVRPPEYGAGLYGYLLSGSGNTVRNSCSFGFADNPAGSGTTADGHNCVDTTACPGTVGNITNAVFANQFLNTVYATLDCRLKIGSNAINAGVTDTTNIPSAADIVGTARPQGASWDIGAWEYTSPGPTPMKPHVIRWGMVV
jgi:hypothetical protein